MVVTPRADVAKHARLLVDPRGEQEYAYEVIGFNYRMTEIAGALGVVQLGALESRNARRRANAKRLTEGFRDLPWLAVPTEPAGFQHVYHQYTIRVPKVRDALSAHLTAASVGNRVYYPSLVTHTPAYRSRGLAADAPAAQRLTQEVLSVPVHPSLEASDVTTIIDAVRAFRGGTV